MSPRRSAESYAVAPIGTLSRRPAPPPDLQREEAEEWVAVVGQMSADYFGRELHGVLASLCRRIVAERRIAERIHVGGLSLEDLDRLLRMLDRESKAVASLAGKLKLTPKSKYSKDKRILAGPRPWDR